MKIITVWLCHSLDGDPDIERKVNKIIDESKITIVKLAYLCISVIKPTARLLP